MLSPHSNNRLRTHAFPQSTPQRGRVDKILMKRREGLWHFPVRKGVPSRDRGNVVTGGIPAPSPAR
jgi:hypothetical protein